MQYLKEDGSLDIEKIRNLPIEEKIKVLPTLTQEQKEDYWAKRPINEGKMGTQPVYVDYTLEDELKNGAALALDFLKEMREKYCR